VEDVVDNEHELDPVPLYEVSLDLGGGLRATTSRREPFRTIDLPCLRCSSLLEATDASSVDASLRLLRLPLPRLLCVSLLRDLLNDPFRKIDLLCRRFSSLLDATDASSTNDPCLGAVADALSFDRVGVAAYFAFVSSLLLV